MTETQTATEIWDGPEHLRPAFFELLLFLGDDALVLGHRLSEWCGRGPFLEEDIALANISLDLIGRADALLKLAGRLEGMGRSGDDLAFLRDATEFRNSALTEVPCGDFAFTMVRQFLFDAYAHPLFGNVAAAAPAALAGIAAKAVKESAYHLRHSAEWVRRFGGGTEESHRRGQAALDDVWMYTGELFESGPATTQLVDAGWLPDSEVLRESWSTVVDRILNEAGFSQPQTSYYFSGARAGRHTEYLGHMLSEMQILARSHPGAEW
jgi:ring-1,2-phenylacetyl-CoA epoxidase subunit PaaC